MCDVVKGCEHSDNSEKDCTNWTDSANKTSSMYVYVPDVLTRPCPVSLSSRCHAQLQCQLFFFSLEIGQKTYARMWTSYKEFTLCGLTMFFILDVSLYLLQFVVSRCTRSVLQRHPTPANGVAVTMFQSQALCRKYVHSLAEFRLLLFFIVVCCYYRLFLSLLVEFVAVVVMIVVVAFLRCKMPLPSQLLMVGGVLLLL